jgi:transposase-like protein
MQLSNPVFHDETAARKHLEALRWPNGVVCPFCAKTETVKPLGGKSMGDGWYHCGECREKFTVRVGTVFERSKIPLHKWLLGFRLMVSSKKGFSAHQLHRTLEITYKSAWFMAHRIREAMRDGSVTPIGGEGKTVEIDETYIGGKESNKHANKRNPLASGGSGKEPVVALVERKGNVRSFHVPEVTAHNVGAILHSQVCRKTRLMTDESRVYNRKVTGAFAGHETVNHSAYEYVRGDAYTNTIENYFSLLKRGIVGTYHHVSQQHLSRYVSEFDFRYNNRKIKDGERADIALKGIEGKRLTYQEAHPAKQTETSV